MAGLSSSDAQKERRKTSFTGRRGSISIKFYFKEAKRMTRPKVWLPEDVLYGERTREALCGIIRAWSRQWGFNQSVTVVISNDRSDHLSPVSPEASITVQGTSIE